MRKGWVTQKVLDFCYVTDFVSNGSFASLRKNVRYINSPDYAILVRLTDFTKKWVNDFVYVSKESFEFLKKSSLVKGDLIMSNVGEPGIVFLVPELNRPMTLGPNSILIRPSTEYASSKFLYLYFLSKNGKEQIDEISTGAAQKKFNKTSFRSLEIPLPPLPEQQRIVTILDEAFAAIDKAKANAEKNLKNAKELFESYLQGVFEINGDGWEEKSLGEVCDFENGDRGKNYPNKSHRVEFGIPFINAGHLNDNEIDYKEMDYISEQRFNMLGNGKIKPNDLLFCLRGSLGKVANVGKLNKGAIASSLVILRVRKQLDNDYFLYFLNSKLTTNQIVDFGNGAAQPNLSAGSLKKFKIPIPTSISNQQKIVQQLNSLSAETKRLESIYQQKLTDLEELKKSILQKAFNGELNTADICV